MRVSSISQAAGRIARACPVRTPRLLAPSHGRPRGQQAARSVSGIEGYVMKPLSSEVELDAERTWLSTALTTWLDEEWMIMPEHAQLGKAAAEAYVGLRRRGEDDMGSVVLAVASELMRPDLSGTFYASFTSPFEVSNKLVETVMLKDGCDVCCTSPSDLDRIRRVNELLSSSSSSSDTGGL